MNMPVSWPCPYCEMNTGGHTMDCPLFQQTQTITVGKIVPLGANFVVSNDDYNALRAERDGLLLGRELYKNLAIQYEKLLLKFMKWADDGGDDVGLFIGTFYKEIDEAIGRFPKSEEMPK